MKRVYFPGLNTIRLYAAFCVVIGHAASYAPESGYTFATDLPTRLNFVILSGYEAVSLFFVLSGFLITYILLTERRDTGAIAVKSFYIKRALRIQPLYFALILLTLAAGALVPQPTITGMVALLLLSPHLAMNGLGAVGHLWSIGVEEWFYFALPPLLRRVSVPALAFAVIGVRLMLALAVPGLMAGDPYAPATLLLHALRFECMAIGALGAWMLINRHWLLKWIYRAELPNLIVLALIIMLNFPGGVAFNLVSSIVFLVFVLNVAANPRHKLGLELPVFARWGAVTYGVYMYHPLLTHLAAAVFVRLGVQGDGLLYAVVCMLVMGTALVSYRVFEQPVMRLREMKSAPIGAPEVI